MRNPYRLGYLRGLLDDDVPIVSKGSELFFGRFHESKIPEIGIMGETGFFGDLIATTVQPAQLPDLVLELRERTPNRVRSGVDPRTFDILERLAADE